MSPLKGQAHLQGFNRACKPTGKPTLMMFPIRSLSECIGADFKEHVCSNTELESANNSENQHPVEKIKRSDESSS